MSKADTAYAAAQREVARVAKAGETALRLVDAAFHALDRIPPELADLTDLRHLRLDRTQISDLAPLAALTNLRMLALNSTQVSDLAPLAALTNLQDLALDNTQVSDLAPLAALTNLQMLALDSTQVSDLAPLAALTNLQRLALDNTQVSDLAPLAALTNLQWLALDNTQISDLAPLAALTNLQDLALDNTQVSDLAPLAALTNLQMLALHSTQVSDLAPLAALTNLQTLTLDSTQVSDLAPLAALTNLQTLTLDNTQVSDLAPLAALTNLQWLALDNTQVSDLAPLAALINLQSLWLDNTQVSDLAPLAALTNLQWLALDSTQVSDLAPLAALTNLQTLRLESTQVSDLAPLAALTNLQDLWLDNTQVSDLRPIIGMEKLGTEARAGLIFKNTPATKRDARLAALADIEAVEDRARETLAYLRTLPPWPDPYTPAATPDGSPPQPIGGNPPEIDAQAEKLSELTPLAEKLVQNPKTGVFSVRYKDIEKPDLLAATLGQVADAIEDVLHDPSNGLNDGSLDIRKLKRTLERYSNDPQRIEMDFTTVYQSLTRQIASEDLPPSDENIALLSALEEGALGIRATDPAVAVNRRILQEQKLRELPPETIEKIRQAAPVLEAITEGGLQDQMREDVHFLTEDMPAALPRLPGVTRDDAIIRGRDEAVRVFGRSSRFLIALRKPGTLIQKLHQSTPYKAAEIIQVLSEIVKWGMSFF